MSEFWDMPRHLEPAQFRREFVMHFAPAQLRRFAWHIYRLERFLRIIFEERGQLLANFASIDIADHDEGEIVRHVSRLVILRHLLLAELVVDFHLADDRKSVWMFLIGRGEQELAHHPVRIVKSHGKLAPDDLLFFHVFLGR